MMAPARSLWGFFGRVVLYLLVLTAVWTQVSRWASVPVGVLTHRVLEVAAPDWVQSVRQSSGTIEAQTRLEVSVKGQRGDLVVDSQTARYGYGLPLLWALLLAAGGPGRWARLFAAYALLLPAQVFSLSLDLLRSMVAAMPGGARALGIAQWQLESIVLGYQLGSLIVPTLVPIMLWLWLDRGFVANVLLPKSLSIR